LSLEGHWKIPLICKKTTDDFLNIVKLFIEQFGSKNIYNLDQSGFQLEIHSGRSLSNQGIKKVQLVVQR